MPRRRGPPTKSSSKRRFSRGPSDRSRTGDESCEANARSQERADMRRRVSRILTGVLLTSGLAIGGVITTEAADPYRIGMGAAITGRFSGGYAPTYEAYKAYF